MGLALLLAAPLPVVVVRDGIDAATVAYGVLVVALGAPQSLAWIATLFERWLASGRRSGDT